MKPGARINYKLDLWREALEYKGFKLSRIKSKYMECKLVKKQLKETNFAMLDNYTYNREIEENVTIIKAGWLKWDNASRLSCDRQIPTKIKGWFDKAA